MYARGPPNGGNTTASFNAGVEGFLQLSWLQQIAINF